MGVAGTTPNRIRNGEEQAERGGLWVELDDPAITVMESKVHTSQGRQGDPQTH